MASEGGRHVADAREEDPDVVVADSHVSRSRLDCFICAWTVLYVPILYVTVLYVPGLDCLICAKICGCTNPNDVVADVHVFAWSILARIRQSRTESGLSNHFQGVPSSLGIGTKRERRLRSIAAPSANHA